MVVMMLMVFGLVIFLFGQKAIITYALDSFWTFYAADAGVEKTFYLEKTSGNLCTICSICQNCFDCTYTPLAQDGCLASSCDNCRLTYNSFTYSDMGQLSVRFNIDAVFTPDASESNVHHLCVESEGLHKNLSRTFNACGKITDQP